MPTQAIEGTYGETVARRVGLHEAPTVTRTIRNAFFAATRLTSDSPRQVNVSHPGNESASIISVQLKDFSHRVLRVEGRTIQPSFLPRGSLNLMDMQMGIEAEINSSFDMIQLYLPHASFERFAEENHARSPGTPQLELGVPTTDPVIENLAQSLLPSLGQSGDVWSIFVDHLALAFYTHLATHYGRLSRQQFFRRGGLAPRQHRRATDMLGAEPGAALSLSDVAMECGLSVSHFTRAFRQTTGLPPHQWVIRNRIEQAKARLMDDDEPLAEIALNCGFSDQSHFTRVFSKLTGVSPGRWRTLSKA